MRSMKFTHGVVLIFLAALGSFFMGMNYVKQDVNMGQPSADFLIALDSEFSEYSRENGAYEAFAAYVASDGVALNGGMQPLIGRENVIAPMIGHPEGAELVWTPEAGDVSASGDLGYTWGRYVFSAPDAEGNRQESHGKYVTVWKLQADGNWKVVLDGGNPNPPPAE